MARKTSARTSAEQQAAEVLAGRTMPTAAELAALVREVNPTDRALDRAQRESRYALKARLQSLLLGRFSEAVMVERAPEQGEGMLLLRLAGDGASAGHVPLLELDEEARSVARQKLDAHAEVNPARSPSKNQVPQGPSPGGSGKTWRQQAQQALDDYDFEEARRCLEVALEAKHQGAAEMLLTLLVDTLGLDQDAWEVASRIDSKTQRSPALRRLLGTAAVRLGHLDAAERELGGLNERDGAPALVLLAQAWLARGREDRTGAWLDAARQADPTEPGIASLERALADRRAGARASEEQAAQRLLDDGKQEEATEAARALLSRFPDSLLARRILREEEQRQRLARLASLAVEIDALEQQGALLSAVELVRRASLLAEPAEQPMWTARAQRLQGAAIEKSLQDEVARVLALRQGEPRPFLHALATSPGEVRARVQGALAQDPLVTWAIQALQSPAVRREQAVDAVLALQHAQGLLDTDPEACLSLLARHTSALEGVVAAVSLRQAAQASSELRRRLKAEALLRQAEDALSQGKSGETLALLSGSVVERWPANEATRARELLARAGEIHLREELQGTFREALSHDDHFGAMRVLERLGEMADPGRWADERASLTLRLRTSLGWRCIEHEGPADAQVAPRSSTNAQPDPCLTLDGQHLVTVSCHERWVFLRAFSARTGRIVRRVQLRAPAPLGLVSAILAGNSVLLESDLGYVLRLSLPGWEPVDFWDSSHLLRQDEMVNSTSCATDGRHLWVAFRQRAGRKERDVVIDLQRRCVVREFKKSRSIEPFLGETPRMSQFSLSRQISLHEPNGNQTSRPVSVEGQPLVVASTADGGYAVLANIDRENAGGIFQLCLLAADGTVRATSRISGLDSERISQCYLAEERIWLWAIDSDNWIYWLVEIDAATLQEIHRQEAPDNLTMVASMAGKHLQMVWGAGEAFRIEAARPGVEVPSSRVCHYRHGLLPILILPSADREEIMRLEREIREQNEAQLDDWISACCQRENNTATFLAAMAEALELTGKREQARLLLERACALHEGDPTLEIRYAHSLLREHRHQEALEHARRADLSRLSSKQEPGLRGYWTEPKSLLEAIAALFLGDLSTANQALQSQNEAFSWSYRTIPGWLRATADAVVPPPPETPDEDDWLLLLVDAVRQADEALAEGDPRAARRALSSIWTFVPGEAQLLARHWQAWLQISPTDPCEIFLATESAAAFLSAMTPKHALPGAPLPGRSWPSSKLEELLNQARAWLQPTG